MKNLLLIIAVFISHICFGQSYVSRAYEATNYFKLSGYKVVGISNDTGYINFRSSYLTTEMAMKLYVARYVSEHTSGGSSPSITGEEHSSSTAATITLSQTPLAGTIKIFKNGIRLPASQYSLAGNVVTLTAARVAIDIFIFDFNF